MRLPLPPADLGRSERARAALLGAALMALAAGSATAATVTVQETAGIARTSWPVTLGVPFSQGALRDGTAVSVTAAGAPTPSQARTLAKWPDGSVRWALVDFTTNLAANQKQSISVQPGTPTKPKASVAVTENAKGWSVDTGALRLTVARGSAAWIESVALGGKALPVRPLMFSMTAEGTVSAARPPDTVTIDERGPVRAQMTLRGRYENGFSYQVRLQAFAGEPFVRVLHSIENTTAPEFTMVDQLSLTVPVSFGAGPAFTAALAGSDVSGPIPEGGTETAQVDNLTWGRDGNPTAGKLDGLFSAGGATASVQLDVPFFWQEYPQAVRFAPDGITYAFWSRAGGSAKFGMGAAKTHEFFLTFGAGGGNSPPQPRRGVVASVSTADLAATRALPSFGRGGSEQVRAKAERSFQGYVESVDTDRWDDTGRAKCPAPDEKVEERPRTGFYGMFNWGDWNYPGYHDTTKGCDAWGNQEYDLSLAMALLYAVTGRADVHEQLVAAARHFSDVDRIFYYPRQPKWVGMNHPKNPLHFSFELGGVDLGHTWVEGLFAYYFLTGDERMRDAGTGIADYLMRRLVDPFQGNPRQYGWPAIALAAAYDATGSGNYREGAREYARRGMKVHSAAKSAADWKGGLLADALCYVHAITGDLTLRHWLVEYADLVLQRNPKDPRFYPAVAYIGTVTGESKYKDAARAAVDRIIFDDWGKPFTIATRTAFRIEALLQ